MTISRKKKPIDSPARDRILEVATRLFTQRPFDEVRGSLRATIVRNNCASRAPATFAMRRRRESTPGTPSIVLENTRKKLTLETSATLLACDTRDLGALAR